MLEVATVSSLRGCGAAAAAAVGQRDQQFEPVSGTALGAARLEKGVQKVAREGLVTHEVVEREVARQVLGLRRAGEGTEEDGEHGPRE